MTATEDEILRFLRKVLLNIALIIASPFFMLAFLFFLLDKPAIWSLVCLAIGFVFVVTGLVVFLVVRARLVKAARAVEWVADNDILRPR